MNDGVICFKDIKSKKISGWGFYLAGIEFSGYNTRETARKWYRDCKMDMFKLLKKYGCSDGQEIFKTLKRSYINRD